MSLYQSGTVSGQDSGAFKLSIGFFILLAFVCLSLHRFFIVASINAGSSLGVSELFGFAFGVVLVVVACLAMFKPKLIFGVIGLLLSVALIFIALSGSAVDDDGLIYFHSSIWIETMLVLNFIIGYASDSSTNLVRDVKLSYVYNSIPPLIFFAAFLALRSKKV